MKKIILFIWVMCFVSIINAQNTDSLKITKNEIGIDATSFIKNILDFSQNGNYYVNTYLVSYKRFFNKTAFRFGLGVNYSTKQDTGGYNSNSNYKNENFSINTRYGVEFRQDFWGKWSFYYGADFIFGYSQSISHNFSSSNGTPDTKRKGFDIGGGPILGLEFYINKKLSLSTEGSLYYIYSKTDTKYEYENPEFNKQALSETNNMNISVPISIFVKYKF